MSPKHNQHQPNHTGSRGRRSRRAFLATIVTGFAVTGLAVQAPAASAATTFTQPTVNVGIIPLPGVTNQAESRGPDPNTGLCHSSYGDDAMRQFLIIQK